MYIEQERMLIMYQLRHVLYITDLDVKLKAEGEHLKLIYNAFFCIFADSRGV